MLTDQVIPEFNAHFVAHRGDSDRYPENTRRAIEAALECGAQYIEFDVQFTRDHEAVVLHDADLRRITGRAGNVLQLTLAELAAYTAHLPEKFGNRFSDEPVATLQTIVALLRDWPQVTAFVELKRASIRQFGVELLMKKLQAVLHPVLQQVVLISFDADAVAQAKLFGFKETGWVFDEWKEEALTTAKQLQPDYVFTDVDCIPDNIATNWSGQSTSGWQWALYEIHDLNIAASWARKGVTLIETDNISEMLQTVSGDQRENKI